MFVSHASESAISPRTLLKSSRTSLTLSLAIETTSACTRSISFGVTDSGAGLFPSSTAIERAGHDGADDGDECDRAGRDHRPHRDRLVGCHALMLP